MRDRRSSRFAHSASSAWQLVRASFFGRLADLVDRVARNHDDDFRVGILDDSLASEPRRRRQPRSLVEQIFFLLTGLAELVESILDDHVAGRACAIAAACMLEMDSMTEHHVENRAGLAVMMKG